MTVVLGLDPGSRNTGWGAIARDGDHLVARAFGVVRQDPDVEFATRLREIHLAVRAIVAEQAPDVVVVEEAFFGKNARSALRLGEARGACVLACSLEKRPVLELAPALVKKAVSGHGGSQKESVRAAVRSWLSLADDAIALDASDALALAIAGLARFEASAALGLPAAALGRSRKRSGARWSAADVARLERGER